ncbi:MAG: hypothetical protein F4000_12515 [Holophagales bacterium]|nr:hypothetical protein [Holophagales bacterium]
MALSTRKRLVMAKLETTSGTAITTAAVDALLVTGLNLTPMTGGLVDRELVRPYYGGADQIPINTHQQVEFATEIAGPGAYTVADAAIAAPQWAKLLEAVGFKAAVFSKIESGDANNSLITYALQSGSEKSLTIRCNYDGAQHTLVGCRGSVVARVASGEIPRMRWTFTGLWSDPAAIAALAPDVSAWKAPRPGSRADTPTVSFAGQSGIKVSSVEIDLGVQVRHREIIGGATEVIISDRAPSGTIVMDAIALGTYNPFTAAQSGTTGALKIVHGGVDNDYASNGNAQAAASNNRTGKLVQFDAPKCQLGEPTYSDDDGIQQWTIPFTLLPNAAAGNDELEIRVR